MLKALALYCLASLLPAFAQAPASTKPTEHVLGTVTAVDSSAHTVTVKEDGSGTEHVISIANTRTLLKVAPGAKDLKSAVRIAADDLQAGDRVDVRGNKSDAGTNAIDARSVVLMSARDLAQKHQADLQAWQNSTVGTVSAIDPATNTLTISVRSAEGPKPFSVHTSPSTDFTRFSADSPNTAVPSQLAAIQVGDQLHILGQKTDDGSSIAATHVYSVTQRSLTGTVTSVSPNGNEVVVKNLESKQPVTIVLNDKSAVRKLDPQMAMFMARRLNPNARENTGAGPRSASAQVGASQPDGGRPGASQPQQGPDASGGAPRPGAGNLAHILERVPLVSAADLKPGNAVIVWGIAEHEGSLLANLILAGVEPILQAAPAGQARSLAADWGVDTSVPAQ